VLLNIAVYYLGLLAIRSKNEEYGEKFHKLLLIAIGLTVTDATIIVCERGLAGGIILLVSLPIFYYVWANTPLVIHLLKERKTLVTPNNNP